jgi:hypothetical protein
MRLGINEGERANEGVDVEGEGKKEDMSVV